MAERRPGDRSAAREQHERNGEALLAGIQTWRDEAPDLPHDHGCRHQDPRHQRHLDVEPEAFAGLRIDEARAWRQHPTAGFEHEGDDAIGEGEGDHHAQSDRERAANQAQAEFLEVLQEAHPAVAQRLFAVLRCCRSMDSDQEKAALLSEY